MRAQSRLGLNMMVPRRRRLAVRRSRMGMSYVDAMLGRPDGTGESVPVRLLIDTGAIYSLLPEPVWKQLGLTPIRSIEFVLADGTAVRRNVSQAGFEIQGERAVSPVVMGEAGDAPLLGSVTLGTLGLMVSPVSRRLLPMRMVLAAESVVPR
jgi:clan AA aspartic protease